jgi:hypothetical protein
MWIAIEVWRRQVKQFRHFLYKHPPTSRISQDINCFIHYLGTDGGVVVETLFYKPEGRGIETRYGD